MQLILKSRHTAQTFVNDEHLLAHFDGIDNGGDGVHSSNTGTWVNLANPAWNATRSGYNTLWTSNSAVFNAKNIAQAFYVGGRYSNSLEPFGAYCTFQVTFKVTNQYFQNYSGILGSHSSNGTYPFTGLVLGQYVNGIIGNGIFRGTQSTEGGVLGTSIDDISPNLFQANTIMNYCYVVSPTGARIYLNGELIRDTQTSVDQTLTTFKNTDFMIGAAWHGNDRILMGEIFDVMAYDRPLSETEVKLNNRYSLNRFSGMHLSSYSAWQILEKMTI